MGIVVRVLYNNQDWRDRCKYPSKDILCSPCFDPRVNVRGPKKDDVSCSSTCWEQQLCTTYEWGCAKGKQFGKRAQPGMKAFFVFRQPDGRYTLWGRTTVESVNVPPTGKTESVKAGYTDYMRFAPFDPLPRDKWVKDLTDIDLVDKPLKQGRFRYVTATKEAQLEQRIGGLAPVMQAERAAAVSPRGDIAVNLTVTPTMFGRLESAANEDGRQIDEIIREAIAEWLKSRNTR